MSSFVRPEKNTLYDIPMSNHSGRVKFIIKAKGLQDEFDIVSPSTIGGSRGPAYLRIHPQGKVPALVTSDGDIIPESDTVSKYLIEKYADRSPSLIPSNMSIKYLGEGITRMHDLYISSIQATMYAPPGIPIGSVGTNRAAGFVELKRQFYIIENQLNYFEEIHPEYRDKLQPFLCGEEISYADAVLYPTLVVALFLLPQVYGYTVTDYVGDRLLTWFEYMSNNVECAIQLKSEMDNALAAWKESGWFAPILAEMKVQE
mmetsp:Transcript_16102/g.16233  ORF Transcript_16102/g.16233 Transcript_16102/m.16233 type:complete len:259 (+) Transcript_16102:133-909(+)|eukprot:CAMPEP_0182428152 /NCGR_PEP_ID=MMETSP1167-20130531/21063_1 /TAXON_ID=2988 /ORGANISM="Mallomonas Sp, Strain CCMP3275" /LENGTH=258 /DNA_ID=CAMNT_0024610853 /DNA_START=80 /DNA_END=856 /DNA_ORIENTATION=-